MSKLSKTAPAATHGLGRVRENLNLLARGDAFTPIIAIDCAGDVYLRPVVQSADEYRRNTTVPGGTFPGTPPSVAMSDNVSPGKAVVGVWVVSKVV